MPTHLVTEGGFSGSQAPLVAEQSEPVFDRIDDAQSLESLGEALIGSADRGAWLQALASTGG